MSETLRTNPNERLWSLDTLRGFDMIMLMGFAGLIRKVGEFVDVPWYNAIEMNMHHVKWIGFSFYDLIFPLFMFVSGIAIPFSILSKKKKGIVNSQLAKKAAITKKTSPDISRCLEVARSKYLPVFNCWFVCITQSE